MQLESFQTQLSARLPSKMQLESLQTQLFCETSFCRKGQVQVQYLYSHTDKGTACAQHLDALGALEIIVSCLITTPQTVPSCRKCAKRNDGKAEGLSDCQLRPVGSSVWLNIYCKVIIQFYTGIYRYYMVLLYMFLLFRFQYFIHPQYSDFGK